MPPTVAEVAGGGPLAAGQLDAAVVVVSAVGTENSAGVDERIEGDEEGGCMSDDDSDEGEGDNNEEVMKEHNNWVEATKKQNADRGALGYDVDEGGAGEDGDYEEDGEGEGDNEDESDEQENQADADRGALGYDVDEGDAGEDGDYEEDGEGEGDNEDESDEQENQAGSGNKRPRPDQNPYGRPQRQRQKR
eukprot:CAMPEP_0171988442 /NCGR_PEP_ID=MMETSP0993-20121228/275906_1 /TAXON_ID=483369 /ORGANISM="non described non described, Strain CCMP2098" /LENGTH=190 /DNA_ID=CAMNT_0012641417 /DNA_START=91 /DNA_END=664 /DNA_ORIENTATION=-